MNMQPVLQARSSSNGYGRRKERDTATRSDNKFQTGKTNSTWGSFRQGERPESSPSDRVIYVSTCLVGKPVEVQVHDGSIYSGVFYATNADDFGIVLKMARVMKDCSQGQMSITDSTSKPPFRTMIISATDLAQVIAKDVTITKDVLNEAHHENEQEIMTDSWISQSHHVDLGRELERWVPDVSDPASSELENIFDGSWNRGWDQFAVNKTLFGVKSTFDEELYTTKLERGPQMREREREATRLAREMEGEDTRDIHLAEERGILLDGNLDFDEEARFSSVLRVTDDSGYDEIEDILLNSRNDETFGGVSESVTDKPLIVGGAANSSAAGRDIYHSSSVDHAQQLIAETGQFPLQSSDLDAKRHDNQIIGPTDSICSKEDIEKQKVPDPSEASKSEESHSLPRLNKESPDKVSLSGKATGFDLSRASSKGQDKTLPVSTPPSLTKVATSSASPSSDRGGATSTGRGLSPSSSVGSLSSEKSTLNPHAKEFKFNPKAKSFVPTQTPLRPSSPVADSSAFYYPANMAGGVTHMHGMPGGVGMGPFPPQQPVVMFNPQGAPIPQPYYHPNGPQMQYGHQMMGQPRPFVYMPTYSPEMPYNQGREFQ